MADFEKLLDSNSERKILNIFFPGLLATWYLWLSAIIDIKNLINKDEKWKMLFKDNTILNITICASAFIFIYGIGHLLRKIAIRIEVLQDSHYQKNLLTGSCIDDNEKDEFDKVWYLYLQEKVNDCPVIIRYYSSFITAYHFELTCVVALIIQLLSILCDYFFNNYLSHRFQFFDMIISLIFACYLFWEANKSTSVAHYLRKKIVAINNQAIIVELEKETQELRKKAADLKAAKSKNKAC
ncbi:MAG: hypothetical protein JSS96_12625 [Bacteroidetes bacterium]|nr:hypothetical protein [Bacteroidota bacterium]